MREYCQYCSIPIDEDEDICDECFNLYHRDFVNNQNYDPLADDEELIDDVEMIPC